MWGWRQWSLRNDADLGNEAVASPGNSRYIAVFAAAFTENAAQGRDVLVEVIFFNNRIRPDGAEEGVFLQHFSASLYQQKQCVEHLRGKGNGPAGSRQEQVPGVHPVVFEFVDRQFAVAHQHVLRIFRNIQNSSDPLK